MRTRQNKSAFHKSASVCTAIHRAAFIYARFENGGKEIRRSLRTTDRASAQGALTWLKQDREQVDAAQGKLTPAELCGRTRQRYNIKSRKPSSESRSFLINQIPPDVLDGLNDR